MDGWNRRPHRLLTWAAAVAAIVVGHLVAGTTAAAAAGPQPDLAVTECRLSNDTTDFGDGVDWWKLRYTYANVGSAATGHFQEIVHGVYKAGVGNHETLTLNQWPMTTGESATREYWITRQTLDDDTWAVTIDAANAVGESDEHNNRCTNANQPDLAITECKIFDDPVNYGDGIDWRKLRYTYTNTGAATTPVPFQITTWFVWKAGHGTEVMDTVTQPAIAPLQTITRELWLTHDVAKVKRNWGVWLDAGNVVGEMHEFNNRCAGGGSPN
jgi:hypothetical protein